jgi:hypothetical protein
MSKHECTTEVRRPLLRIAPDCGIEVLPCFLVMFTSANSVPLVIVCPAESSLHLDKPSPSQVKSLVRLHSNCAADEGDNYQESQFSFHTWLTYSFSGSYGFENYIRICRSLCGGQCQQISVGLSYGDAELGDPTSSGIIWAHNRVYFATSRTD